MYLSTHDGVTKKKIGTKKLYALMFLVYFRARLISFQKRKKVLVKHSMEISRFSMSLRFYVKSFLTIIEVQNLPFLKTLFRGPEF